MPNTNTEDIKSMGKDIQNTAASLKNQVSDTASQAKDKAQEMGRNVQSKIDETRAPAAEKLEGAASALHEKADQLPGGETVAGLAHSAADKMHSTAEYVREHDVQGMMSDVESFARKHPGQSLLAAAAVGFLIGRSFRSES